MSKVSNLNLNNPHITKGRSKFVLTHTHHTDFNAGFLVPLDVPIEVMPGDTLKVSQRTIIRMSNPPKVPVMDTLTMTVAYYYCPFRILWDNWDKFITADNGTQWDTDLSLLVPQIYLDLGNVTGKIFTSSATGAGFTRVQLAQGGLLDFLGIPTQVKSSSSGTDTAYINCRIRKFEANGYYKIWNRFWRYEPLMDEILVDTSDNGVTLDQSRTYTDGVKSNKLCPVVRFADYFSRALPQPQRGQDVLMDLSLPENYDLDSLGYINVLSDAGSSDTNIIASGQPIEIGDYYKNQLSVGSDGGVYGFSNFYGGTINALREAFAIQRLKDIDARYGSRIGEFTIGHYGVNVPDFRVSEPEELAYKNFDINVNQVVQTSQTTESSPQGTTGAYSITNHFDHYFTKSFVEWGLVYCVGCVRVKNHSFAQGIPHQYNQSSRFDYYFPELANISDMPIYENEIFVSGVWSNVFGYQEAWAHYKYLPSHVTHHMRPQAPNTLGIWTYTDLFDSAPTLSSGWVTEPKTNIDRTMYLTSGDTISQFIADICFFIDGYREIPYHSVPGGLTHEF